MSSIYTGEGNNENNVTEPANGSTPMTYLMFSVKKLELPGDKSGASVKRGTCGVARSGNPQWARRLISVWPSQSRPPPLKDVAQLASAWIFSTE